MKVQRLGATDLSLLRQLNTMFGAAFNEAGTYADAPPDDGYLRRTLDQPHVIVLAALYDEQVVGGLVAYDLPKLEQARSEIYLYDLAVAEPYRRRGIATSLIAALRDIARERGAWVVFVQADQGDDAAISLYQKLGVREEVLHFDLPVAQADTP